MLYNYTVTLQSKQNHKPRRYKTKAKNLSEVMTRLKGTLLAYYSIKSIVRRPQ